MYVLGKVMSYKTQNKTSFVKGVLIGGIASISLLLLAAWASDKLGLINKYLTSEPGKGMSLNEHQSKSDPLYWVAPMDPNFRRDKPGKSPMGMDLVPVYEKDQTETNTETVSAGEVTVSPEMANNLAMQTQMLSKTSKTGLVTLPVVVNYDEAFTRSITLQTSGWVRTVNVHYVGQAVKKGEVLFTYYSLALINAQQDVLSAMNTQSESLVAAAEVRLLSLGYPQSLIGQLKQSKRVVDAVPYFSNQTGVVTTVAIKQGSFVNDSTAVLKVASPNKLWFDVSVPLRLSNLVKLGNVITIASHSQLTTKVSITEILPSVERSTQSMIARARHTMPLNYDENIKPNWFDGQITQAQMTITSEPGLWLPSSAVIRDRDLLEGRVILNVGDNTFKSVHVKFDQVFNGFLRVDPTSDNNTTLQEGDVIATTAIFLIDSESNVESDLQRLNGAQSSYQADTSMDYPSAEVMGTVNKIDRTNRIINISRGPIKKWGRPATTMDFEVRAGIDIKSLRPTDKIHFAFVVKPDAFEINMIHVLTEQRHD